MIRWLVAAGHLLGLGIGLGAVWARARALRGPLDSTGIRQVLVADGWWGVAAAVWISTGLWRFLGGLEKGTAYYLDNHVFWTKMALLGLILMLEIGPIVTFTGWRRQVAAGGVPDLSPAPRIARISVVQALLVILMVLAATAMARGYGVVR
jgi:putative membrane protein